MAGLQWRIKMSDGWRQLKLAQCFRVGGCTYSGLQLYWCSVFRLFTSPSLMETGGEGGEEGVQGAVQLHLCSSQSWCKYRLHLPFFCWKAPICPLCRVGSYSAVTQSPVLVHTTKFQWSRKHKKLKSLSFSFQISSSILLQSEHVRKCACTAETYKHTSAAGPHFLTKLLGENFQ